MAEARAEYVSEYIFRDRVSYKRLQKNQNYFNALQQVPPFIIDKIRRNFDAAKEIIKGCSKPWPPWALVHLLDIDDTSSPIPAEMMLYQALQRPNRVGGLILPHNNVIQVNILHMRSISFCLHTRTHYMHAGAIRVSNSCWRYVFS